MKNQGDRVLVHHSFPKRAIALFVLLSFMISLSCTSTKVYPVQGERSQEQAHGIKIGDTVKIRTLKGQKYRFKVENISSEKIEGEGIKLTFSEIDSIKKEHISKKVIFFAAALIAVVVAILIFGSDSDSDSNDDRDYPTKPEGEGQ